VRICVCGLCARVCRLPTYVDISFKDLDSKNTTGLGFNFPSAIKSMAKIKPKRKQLPKVKEFVKQRVLLLVSVCVCVCVCVCACVCVCY
jgi:hypothetical protein